METLSEHIDTIIESKSVLPYVKSKIHSDNIDNLISDISIMIWIGDKVGDIPVERIFYARDDDNQCIHIAIGKLSNYNPISSYASYCGTVMYEVTMDEILEMRIIYGNTEEMKMIDRVMRNSDLHNRSLWYTDNDNDNDNDSH